MKTQQEAIYDVVFNSKLPAKVIAAELGVSYSYLANAANPDLDLKFQSPLITPITRLTDNYAIVDAIESALGRVAVKLPPAGEFASCESLTLQGLNASAEFGDLMKELQAVAKSGDKPTMEHKARIQKEGYEAIQAIVAIMDRNRNNEC